MTKNQFYFFFVFENYVNWTLSDQSFEPTFQMRQLLVWQDFSDLMVHHY